MFWIVFAFRYESQCGYCIFVIKPLFKITQLFAKVKIEGIPMFIEFQLWTRTRTHSEWNLNYVAKTSLSSNQGCFAANICRKIWLYRYIECNLRQILLKKARFSCESVWVHYGWTDGWTVKENHIYLFAY